MKRATFITGVTMAALAITTVAAFADTDGGKRHGMSFENIDADNDGQITQAEMEATAKARFSAADTDSDGFLSQEEMEAAGRERMQKHMASMMERMDTDGDGKIAMAEMKPRHDPSEMFNKADADGDGSISKEEFEEMRGMRGMRGRHGAHQHD